MRIQGTFSVHYPFPFIASLIRSRHNRHLINLQMHLFISSSLTLGSHGVASLPVIFHGPDEVTMMSQTLLCFQSIHIPKNDIYIPSQPKHMHPFPQSSFPPFSFMPFFCFIVILFRGKYTLSTLQYGKEGDGSIQKLWG